MEESWESHWQQFLKTVQSVHPGEDKSKMSEVSPWEDPKVFLASFEQVARACRWPTEEWVDCLLPALSREAEDAFQKLKIGERDNYGKVKAAILKGEATKTEARRQRFRQFCCQEVEDPRMVYKQIQELCHQWLKPERHSKEQILELLILEQFLASLPPKLQSWVQPRSPITCSEAVALVEDFLLRQPGTESEACQGPPNEEPTNFECAEKEPSEAVKRENVEVEIGMLGPGIESPDPPSSLLPSERLGMVQTALRETVTDLKERDICLLTAKWDPVQPVPKRMSWEAPQSEHRNIGSLSSSLERNITNRYSTASRIIENSFGILATRWRILGRLLDFHPNKVTDVVKGCVTLRNDLINSDATNTPTANFVDTVSVSGGIQEGEWRLVAPDVR